MQRYILRRLLVAIPVLLLMSFVTFSFVELAPGDVVVTMVGGSQGYLNVSRERIEEMREELGLNRPFYERYVIWLSEIVRGNLGARFKDGRPVATLISERVLPTMELMGMGLLLACLIGIPLGVISALNQNSLLDYVLTVFAFTGVSVPPFFFGMVLLYVFGLRLGWLPIGGMRTAAAPFSYLDHLRHLILPAFAVAFFTMGDLMRFARASMLEVLRDDYVRTARAKGLSETTVIVRHVFRNALLPLITIVGLRLADVVGGSVIIEYIFQWPGMGRLFLQGIDLRDPSLIMANLLAFGSAVVFASIVADIAYALVDPRIRYE